VYAAASAVLRALYALFTAVPCAAIAVPRDDSRAATAVPTHAIDVDEALPDVPRSRASAVPAKAKLIRRAITRKLRIIDIYEVKKGPRKGPYNKYRP